MSAATKPESAPLQVSCSEFPGVETVAGAGLFNDPRFYRLHTRDRRGVYCSVRSAGRLVAVAHAIETSAGSWASPGRGTYGGAQLFTDLDARHVLSSTYSALVDAVQHRGASSLSITLPPAIHDPDAMQLADEVLASLGFAEAVVELHHSLAVDDFALVGRMSGSKAYDVRRARRIGMSARLLTPEERAEGFDVLAESRARRDLPLTMTLADLEEMTQTFPDRVFWMGAFLSGELVGVMIMLRVRSDVLYIAYPGERTHALRLSPVTFMVDEAYRLSQSLGIALLDYGTSSIDGAPLEGLAHYKAWLGCDAGERKTWLKTFS